MRRPAYFCSPRPRPASSSHTSKREHDHPDRRQHHRQHRRHHRRGLGEQRQKALAVLIQAGPDPGQEGQGGEDPDRGTDDPADQSRPDLVAAATQRAGEHQRADRQREPSHRERQRTPFELLSAGAALEQEQQCRTDRHPDQERNALQEIETGVREVDLDVAGGETADRERGQKRPNPHRGGDADPLEYVEDQMQRAVP